jgi:hypothetical protein
MRTVPGWTLSQDSAANAGQTLTQPASANERHYVNSIEVCTSAAAPTADIVVRLLEGATVRWKTVIGSGMSRGERTGISFANPIQFGVGIAATLDISAGGAGVITTGNIEGFTI